MSRSSSGNALYLSMIDAPNRINNLAPALARFTSKQGHRTNKGEEDEKNRGNDPLQPTFLLEACDKVYESMCSSPGFHH